MARLGSSLRSYLDDGPLRASLGEGAAIRVVAKLTAAPAISMSRVPRSPRARGIRVAMSALHRAGMGADVSVLPDLRPKQLIAGLPSVSMEVRGRDLEALAATPGVEYVRALRMHRQHLDVSVPLVGVDARVRSQYTGRGVTVAVIDSGIDADHPDLTGRVLVSKSRNFTSDGRVNDVSDTSGHGTHVAGIIGGAGRRYRGVAPGVRLIACKVFGADGQAEEGAVIGAVRWAVEQGADIINYSGGFVPILHHPALGPLTMVAPPWVWPAEPIEEEGEFLRAIARGVVCVVSAGNEGANGARGTLSMPATAHDLISVGAIGRGLTRSSFSSRGPSFRSSLVHPADAPQTLTPALAAKAFPEVDLLAPGGEIDPMGAFAGGCYAQPGIVSARSAEATADDPCRVNSVYASASGTSQSAPHIAGLAALVLEAVHTRAITLGVRRAYAVKALLCRAAEPLDGYTEDEQGRGMPSWPRVEEQIARLAESRLVPGSFAEETITHE